MTYLRQVLVQNIQNLKFVKNIHHEKYYIQMQCNIILNNMYFFTFLYFFGVVFSLYDLTLFFPSNCTTVRAKCLHR